MYSGRYSNLGTVDVPSNKDQPNDFVKLEIFDSCIIGKPIRNCFLEINARISLLKKIS